MTVRSADALRSIGALLRAPVASHSAHRFTRSFPHGAPFHARDGICSHGPPRPGIVPAGALRQRAPASAIRTAVVAPAFRKLSAFLRDTYLPSARTTTGMRDL